MVILELAILLLLRTLDRLETRHVLLTQLDSTVQLIQLPFSFKNVLLFSLLLLLEQLSGLDEFKVGLALLNEPVQELVPLGDFLQRLFLHLERLLFRGELLRGPFPFISQDHGVHRDSLGLVLFDSRLQLLSHLN